MASSEVLSGGIDLLFGPPNIRALDFHKVRIDRHGILRGVADHSEISGTAQLIVYGPEEELTACGGDGGTLEKV